MKLFYFYSWFKVAIVLCCAALCAYSSLDKRDIDELEAYLVVIDAGSTGSRGFVYKIQTDAKNGNRHVETFNLGKIKPGISAYVSEPSKAAEHLHKLLSKAEEYIPHDHRTMARLLIKGTAGMRLLTEAEQEYVWHEVIDFLQKNNHLGLLIDERSAGTLTGEQEAFYGVISSNFVADRIDSNLIPKILHNGEEAKLLGALDLGGGSTQFVVPTFKNKGTDENTNNGNGGGIGADKTDIETQQRGKKVQENDFWFHSWLSLGAEAVREKAHGVVLEDARISIANDIASGSGSAGISSESGMSTDSTSSSSTANPCAVSGYTFLYADEHEMHGTGSFEHCFNVVSDVLWPEGLDEHCQDNIHGKTCAVDSIHVPTVHDGEFYAMSAYFYALDCIRHYSYIGRDDELESWPSPTIHEVEEMVTRYCQLPWSFIENEYLHNNNAHPYTSLDQLPHRCLEGVYIVALLHKAFGFKHDQQQITFALEVNGNEVDWTLGYALSV